MTSQNMFRNPKTVLRVMKTYDLLSEIRRQRKWQQIVNLVLDTIQLAMKLQKKAVDAELQLHSGQGFQYTSQAYFQLTKQYGIAPSTSRKGEPYDNAMAENFFSILKIGCIYRHKPATFSEANR